MLEPNTYIVGIDPGNIKSAFCLCDPDLKPLAFEKCDNMLYDGAEEHDLFFDHVKEAMVEHIPAYVPFEVVIEDLENFGMPVGRSMFDTAKYIGRLDLLFHLVFNCRTHHIFRHEEKMAICHSAKANDATIRQALVDRFAPGQKNHGKGTKADRGFFYGFSADVWSSFAICTAFHDREKDLPF